MTPEEIQERLRQAGISQSEAIQRARAEGVSLEEYLGARVEREETRPDTGIRKPATPLPLPTRLPYRIR